MRIRNRSKWALLSFIATACSINPATGEREISLVSEEQEIAMGREADPAVTAEMGGEYDDPELTRYVTAIGDRLAADSERPDLPWTFRVLDDDLINAFALPGGYVYVTRGIVTQMESEAELAAVLGHEIGHVTARHTARQISRQQLGALGLGIGMIFSETLRDYGGAAVAALQLLSLKHSRDAEREADLLGFRYMTQERYDPEGMSEVMRMLARTSPASSAAGIPSWLATHPDPGDRVNDNEERIANANVDFGSYRTARDDFLNTVEGTVFGDDPSQGYFIGARFLHPTLRFEITFPGGWAVQNAPLAVRAGEPDDRAGMLLTFAEAVNAGTALQEFIGSEGIEPLNPWSSTINGVPARGTTFQATTEDGLLRGNVAFFEYGDAVYRVVGISAAQSWTSYASAVSAAIQSFAPLSNSRYLAVSPHRVDVVTLRRAMTGSEFLSDYPPSIDEGEALRVNRIDRDSRLPAGARLKWIKGGAVPSS